MLGHSVAIIYSFRYSNQSCLFLNQKTAPSPRISARLQRLEYATIMAWQERARPFAHAEELSYES